MTVKNHDFYMGEKIVRGHRYAIYAHATTYGADMESSIWIHAKRTFPATAKKPFAHTVHINPNGTLSGNYPGQSVPLGESRVVAKHLSRICMGTGVLNWALVDNSAVKLYKVGGYYLCTHGDNVTFGDYELVSKAYNAIVPDAYSIPEW